MKSRLPARRCASGLTIIEVLVVLIIFGIGWFAILPNLNLLDKTKTEDSALTRLNAFMTEARNQAMKTGSIERMVVIPGKKILSWGNDATVFPGVVSRCLVNGRQYFDRPTELRVYPSGSMDDVRIVLDGGTVLTANVLGVEFVAVQ